MKIVGRVLREPFTARAWRELAYSMLSLPPALLGLAALLVTCSIAILATGVKLPPLLPLVPAADRGLGRSTAAWPECCRA